ncbi:MAG: hypothetical protein F6K56_12330 [Moorea sp. SIO3G5]|nr:hypothetical protein [Moorena sp. SIO3G5]
MRYTLFFPYSLFPIPYSLFPVPCSLFPIPCSLKTQKFVLHRLENRCKLWQIISPFRNLL